MIRPRRTASGADSHARLRRFASRASLTVAIILVGVKLAGWVLTSSVALLSSSIDAMVDAAASLATFYGVRYAERPPDDEHRFGHGKGEAIAGFIQAAFLAGAALVLAFQSAERLRFPEPIQQIGLGFTIIIASLIAAAALVALQTWILTQTKSTAIAADRAHYLTDVAVNLAVLLAFCVTRFTGAERADPAFGLGIAGYMLWNGRGIALGTLRQLLDRELPADYRTRITATALACTDVRGVHDLRTRYAGDRIFIDFHLEVDPNLTVARGHEICDAVELAVAGLFLVAVDVSTHMEPAGIEDERLDKLVSPSSQ